MPGQVIGIEMGMGYPGTYARTPDAIIMNRVAATDLKFGMAAVLNSDNTYSAFGASDTAATFGGVVIREVKQATGYFTQGDAYYEQGAQADVIERGNVVVACQNGTPTAGGAVYVRTVANASYPNAVVGGFEAAADGSNSVKLTNAYWTTGKIDADLNAELTIKYKA